MVLTNDKIETVIRLWEAYYGPRPHPADAMLDTNTSASKGYSYSSDEADARLLAMATNPYRRALVAFLESLTRSEMNELAALMWLGRDGFNLSEWDHWVHHASGQTDEGIVLYIMQKAPLSAYLRKGWKRLTAPAANENEAEDPEQSAG